MTFVCGICGRQFDDEAALETHEHRTRAPEDERLSCMVCGESFAREEDLLRHQADDHVGIEPTDEEQAVP
jgi:DNA-directed RNA polymerase subunit RPC12/RpoP